MLQSHYFHTVVSTSLLLKVTAVPVSQVVGVYPRWDLVPVLKRWSRGRKLLQWVSHWMRAGGWQQQQNSSWARDEQQEIERGRWGHATTVPVLKLGFSENVEAHIWRVVAQGTEAGLLLCVCGYFCVLHLQQTQA